MITNVYVDGFNLYYGAVKNTPYKWLDISKLSGLLLPGHSINKIRYFTALVTPRQPDLQQRQRQETYIRALQTIPGVSVHYGSFLVKRKRRPLATPPPNGPRTVEVLDTEEKGSDVNLATYLLLDAFRGDMEQAVVISNDSDLVEPIRLVMTELGIPVGLLNPHPKPTFQLRNVAKFYKPIRKGVLAASQFPPSLIDRAGTITRPSGW